MQRYFLEKEGNFIDLDKGQIIIMSDDVHHIKNVMRMKVSDQIIVCYNDLTYLCEIDLINNNDVHLSIIKEMVENKELPCEVTIAHGLVRREKMEEVIDHITELGASSYLPVIMTRSNVKFDKDKSSQKLIRLNKIAKEAAEQSHRNKVLKVHDIISFKELLNVSKEYDLCLVAHVDEEPSVYIGSAINDAKKILVLVGPEGGIDQAEITALKKCGFIQVNLGKRVLRTEVAPSYIMSVIDMIRGQNNEI